MKEVEKESKNGTEMSKNFLEENNILVMKDFGVLEGLENNSEIMDKERVEKEIRIEIGVGVEEEEQTLEKQFWKECMNQEIVEKGRKKGKEKVTEKEIEVKRQ